MIVRRYPLTKTVGFWALYALLAAAGFWFTYIYFPKTFSIVNLDIRIDREEAIEKARTISQQFGWDVTSYNDACTFKTDETVKTYIELEAGGPEALTKIIEEKFYSPYTWQVRFFKENEINEIYLFFMPDGRPYGLYRIIPEAQEGPALSTEEAKDKALENLQFWSIDINQFTLVENSQETKPNKRVDHTFVYELKDKKVGNAPYRLTLNVSGDQLAQLWLKVKVPESFTRYYAQMRSYNETLSRFAGIVMIILYFIGGVLLSLIYLARRRMLLIGPALWWGVGIAFLQLLVHFNGLPNYWMYYQTAHSRLTFLSQFIVSGVIQFLFMAGAGTLVILAAEGLSRLVFPHHIQLWKAWSLKEAARSIQMLGRTIGGYLFAGLELAYVVSFYFLASHFLGWWHPADSLYSPDVLAQYFPWLSPVVRALAAGFLEECLFRAIPLSCAVLLGQRFGKKSWWIIGAVILQALVFGAAHASYPAQPFYARLIELIIPSVALALIFLSFGLVVTIIAHVIYDVILMSIPIFITNSPEFLIDKIMIIVCSLIPLFIIIFARIKGGSWIHLPSIFYNHAWHPAPLKKESERQAEIKVDTHHKPYSLFILSVVSAICLALWVGFTSFKADIIPLQLTRSQAIELAKKQITFSDENKAMIPLAALINPMDKSKERDRAEHIFVWRTGGKEVFHDLLKNYLLPPSWLIRFVNFTGDVAKRAEEYQVTIIDRDTIARIKHVLPEDEKAEEISKEQARDLVKNKVLSSYPQENFTEISVIEQKHPQRRDWKFTYGTDIPGLKEGQKRVSATVSGNAIIDNHGLVFVPESWIRTLNNEYAIKDLIVLITTMLFFLLLIGVSLILLRRLHIQAFSISIFLTFLIALVMRTVVQLINMLSQYAITFNTSEPYRHQLFSLITTLSTRSFFSALIYSVIAGFVIMLPARSVQLYKSLSQRWIVGLSIGALLATLPLLQKLFGLSLEPLWPELTPAGGLVPGMSEGLFNFMHFIQDGILALVVFALIDRLTDGWRYYKWYAGIFIVALALLKQPIPTTLWHAGIMGIIVGIIMLLLYVIILRFSRASIPIAVATYISLQSIQQGFFMAYSGSLWIPVITLILLNLAAEWWSEKIAHVDL